MLPLPTHVICLFYFKKSPQNPTFEDTCADWLFTPLQDELVKM